MTDGKTACHNRMSKYISQSNFSIIREELSEAGASAYECYPVTDVIFSGSSDLRGKNAVSEKYILRCPQNDKNSILLIKESSMGNKIKEIIQPISFDTATRIIQRSTKWLCTSLSPLIRELGVKMTTNRLAPDTVMSFERECFVMDNRLKITADSHIALSEYDGSGMLCTAGNVSDPVDVNVCLLQINYERIIPENILSIIGMKVK